MAFTLGVWLLGENMDRLLPEYSVVGLEANEDGAKGWKCLSSPLFVGT